MTSKKEIASEPLVWTAEVFKHRAQGMRRVYWVIGELVGINRFKPAIQRGAVTFNGDVSFHDVEDAKHFCQSDHDSIRRLIDEGQREVLKPFHPIDDWDLPVEKMLELAKRERSNSEAELEKAYAHLEEMRLRMPTTAQLMVYESLLMKYKLVKEELETLKKFRA